MKSQESEKADIQLAKALELDPARAEAHYYRGVIAFARRDGKNAQANLDRFLDLQARSPYAADAHFLLASIAMEGATEGPTSAVARARARTHFEKFLEIRPKAPRSARAHFLIGSLALEDGEREVAVAHLEKCLELEPRGEDAERARALLSSL
jgi:tetratricopeptide (TPR) repeat protein